MAFDLRGMLTAAQALAAGLPTVIATSAQGYMGVPESFAARINYFVFLGPATPVDDMMGGQTLEPVVMIVFGYRVAAVEQTAELVIADLILELIDAVQANPTIGGTVDPGRVKLDMSGASAPEYRAIAGSENRLYPIAIHGFQQRTVA